MAGLPKFTRGPILAEVLQNTDCIAKNSKKKNEEEKLRDMLTDFAGGLDLDSGIFVSTGLKVLWPIYQLCKDRHSAKNILATAVISPALVFEKESKVWLKTTSRRLLEDGVLSSLP